MSFFDLAYGLGLGIAAPFWLLKSSARRKVFEAFRNRMGREPGRQTSHPALMLHAVSVGEVNATPALIRMLEQARPELRFVISTTTAKGYERALELYGNNPKASLIRYPLDFSGAVTRVLDAQRPTIVVLMELEVWPNFMRACAHHEIPVLLVNGRLTHGSYRNYRLAGLFTKPMFRKLSFVCAQDQTHAERFNKMGVATDRVRVTGTMKFDTAEITDRVAGTGELAQSVGLRPGSELIWVCGSTGPGEEQVVLDAFAELQRSHAGLRLVIVPRKPERFDEVAELMRQRGHALVRRSETRSRTRGPAPMTSTANPPVILGDTMGELRKFYSMADVVFVGRTLLDLGQKQHGSDMIEPAALAKPIIVGPYTTNFAEAMSRFREANAIREVQPTKNCTAAKVLEEAVGELLSAKTAAVAMGEKARNVVRANQGATTRNIEAIIAYLPRVRR